MGFKTSKCHGEPWNVYQSPNLVGPVNLPLVIVLRMADVLLLFSIHCHRKGPQPRDLLEAFVQGREQSVDNIWQEIGCLSRYDCHVGLKFPAKIFELVNRKYVFSGFKKWDPYQTPTILMFAFFQLFYVIMSLIPTMLMYNNEFMNATYLVVLTVAAVWKGGTYYISIFSQR
jgi:hypothetical protein